MFPDLSGSSLGGCDTNPYKASIIERKVAATDADDIQKVRHLAALAHGVLPRLVNSSFTEHCSLANMAEDKRISALKRKEVQLTGSCSSNQKYKCVYCANW